MPKLSRRTILATIAGAAVAVPAWFVFKKWPFVKFMEVMDLPDWVYVEQRTDGPELAPAELATLWLIFKSLADLWNLSDVTREQFDGMIREKCSHAPSYAAEYRIAIRWLGATPSDSDVARKVSELVHRPAPKEDHTSDEAHVRKWVVYEFCRYQLAMGGYKAFGAASVPGFPLGPFGYTKAGPV